MTFYKNKITGELVKLDREDSTDGWNYWKVEFQTGTKFYDFVGVTSAYSKIEVENNENWVKLEI